MGAMISRNPERLVREEVLPRDSANSFCGNNAAAQCVFDLASSIGIYNNAVGASGVGVFCFNR